MTTVALSTSHLHRDSATPPPLVRRLLLGIGVAVTYVAAAKAGFLVAFVAEQVTTVWAPTGIAIATLLLCGVRLWPAIWLGAFVVNASTSAPLWTAVFVASGNTLEAVAAASILRRIPSFDCRFERLADVLMFVPIAVVGCTTLSASVGTMALCTAGVQPWAQFGSVFFDWWLGDALGALVVTPPILTIASAPRPSRSDLWRWTLFVVCAVVVTDVAFGRLGVGAPHPLEYVVFPLMIAAAIAGGPPLTSFVVLVSSVVIIWNTVRGAVPFPGSEMHHNLIFLQTFTGVLGTTALLLSAAVAERKAIELRHRQSADTLRQRERMLRLAQRAGGVATFEWDFHNQIAKCSAEFFAIFGLPHRDGEMNGSEWAEFVHPDDRKRMAAHLGRALQGVEAAAADYRIIRADGAERWLMYAGQIEQMPGGARMLGTVLDVTDRVKAEAALRESRDVLSLAMRGGSMGAWSRDLLTNDVWWSRELEEIVGLEEGAFARTEAQFFDLVHPDDRARVREAVDTAVECRSDYVVEFRFHHANGDWRWMEGRGRAVYADDGIPRTLYGLGIDVTVRKRAEAALSDAKNAAESANRVKDQFLATLSHELRTPLNAILGYARMLQTDSIVPEKRPRAIDIIVRNATAQHQLIEDLLDISRITRGQMRLETAPMPIAAALRDAIEGVRPAAEAKRLTVDVDIDPFAGTVNADATRMQQVFWNLLTNAVKFTEQGGKVTITLRRTGDHVVVRVCDTGIGIAPDFLPFIFEPFRQADGSLVRGHGGLGLGLAISRQLVELHGGTVTAASAGIGRGAAFVVRLPAQIDEGSPTAFSGDATG